MRALLKLLSNIHETNMATWFERAFVLFTAAVVFDLAWQMPMWMACYQSWIAEIHFPYDQDNVLQGKFPTWLSYR